MENPATWKRAERVIADAYAEWHEMSSAGATGLSLPALTARHLRLHGIVADQDEPAIGWEGLKPVRTDREPENDRPHCRGCWTGVPDSGSTLCSACNARADAAEKAAAERKAGKKK